MWSEARANRWFPALFGVLVAGALLTYFIFRQRYIGACDWFGYYELARLFREGRVFLETSLPIDQFPSSVPLGFFPIEGKGVPQYTPGYPFLLALAGYVNAELLVNPLIGALSAVVLFLAARDLTGNRWVALATMGVWLLFPIVVFGATTIMSDLVATVPLIASYLLYRRGKIPWSALLLGFSFSVRPTNVLYCLPFAIPLLRDGNVVRYVAWLVPSVLPYAFYNFRVYGAPWNTGYPYVMGDVVRILFSGHFGFYLWETLRQLGPLCLLVAFGCKEGRRSEVVFFALWSAIFVFFYSFWRSGGDVWWWIRFILPGYPPLFFLAALGLQRLWREANERFPSASARRWACGLLLALLFVTPFYQVYIGLAGRDLWRRNKGREFPMVIKIMEEYAPPGSFIGSIEFGGSFRLYTSYVPFVSTHENALQLVPEAYRQGRDVFLIVEPASANDRVIAELLRRYAAVKLREIPLWGGVAVYRLNRPAP